MHSQRKEIKADHGPERPALGAFHQSLQPELRALTPPPRRLELQERAGTVLPQHHCFQLAHRHIHHCRTVGQESRCARQPFWIVLFCRCKGVTVHGFEGLRPMESCKMGEQIPPGCQNLLMRNSGILRLLPMCCAKACFRFLGASIPKNTKYTAGHGDRRKGRHMWTA